MDTLHVISREQAKELFTPKNCLGVLVIEGNKHFFICLKCGSCDNVLAKGKTNQEKLHDVWDTTISSLIEPTFIFFNLMESRRFIRCILGDHSNLFNLEKYFSFIPEKITNLEECICQFNTTF